MADEKAVQSTEPEKMENAAGTEPILDIRELISRFSGLEGKVASLNLEKGISAAANCVTSLEQMRRTAEAAVESIHELKETASTDGQLVAAAKAKAEGEALAAHQAKTYTEEHSTFIATKKGAAEVDIAALASTKKLAEENAQVIEQVKSGAEISAKAISDAKQVAESNQSASSTAKEHAESDLGGIRKLKGKIERDSQSLEALAQTAKASADTINTWKDQASAVLATIQENQARSITAATTADEHAKDAADALSSSQDVLKTANESQARVAKYEAELKSLQSLFQGLNEKVEGLLPHAASAGLASAFREQKQRFRKPQFYWLVTFVATLGVLFLMSLIWVPWHFSGERSTWDETFKFLVQRLPIIIPLIWLALYAGRQYMLALRLEEDYAYKEAISTAFEGYKREMTAVTQTGKDQPIIVLCDNVLTALAERPGRIYDGPLKDITPLNEVKNAVVPTPSQP